MQLRERTRNKEQSKSQSQSPVRSLNKQDLSDKLQSRRRKDKSTTKRHSKKNREEPEPEKQPTESMVGGNSTAIDVKLKTTEAKSKVVEEKSRVIAVKSEVIQEKSKAVDEKPKDIEEKPKIDVKSVPKKSKIELQFSKDVKVESLDREKCSSSDANTCVNGDNALEEGEIDDDCDDANDNNQEEIKQEFDKPKISATESEIVKQIECVSIGKSTKIDKIKNRSSCTVHLPLEFTAVKKSETGNLLVPTDRTSKMELDSEVGENDRIDEQSKETAIDSNSVPKSVDQTEAVGMPSHENESIEKFELEKECSNDQTNEQQPQSVQNSADVTKSEEMPLNIDKTENSIEQEEIKCVNSGTPSPALLENSSNLTEREQSKSISELAENLSFDGLMNGVLNTSGNKSVKNISTSSKNYLIVEDENNETTIYVTRKKKKKKKKKSKEDMEKSDVRSS